LHDGMKNAKRNGKKHIPPNDVVERFFYASKPTRGNEQIPILLQPSLAFALQMALLYNAALTGNTHARSEGI